MSITKITDPASVPAAVADYQAQNIQIKTALTGLSKITLSNYDNDSAPAVKVGSIIDVGGTLYIVSTSDETPTGYSGISNSVTFYLYFDSSAEVFIYSSTAPTWNDAYHGWYNGDDRALATMYKDSGGTLYQNKNIYKGRYKERPMQIETQSVTADLTGQSNGLKTIEVTGFSFNPTAVLNANLILWNTVGTEGYTYKGVASYPGESMGGDSTDPLTITGFTFGAGSVTIRYYVDITVFTAAYSYRITVTAARSQ